jgi:hypothetical protein
LESYDRMVICHQNLEQISEQVKNLSVAPITDATTMTHDDMLVCCEDVSEIWTKATCRHLLAADGKKRCKTRKHNPICGLCSTQCKRLGLVCSSNKQGRPRINNNNDDDESEDVGTSPIVLKLMKIFKTTVWMLVLLQMKLKII